MSPGRPLPRAPRYGRRALLKRSLVVAGAGAMARGAGIAGFLVPGGVARAAGGPRILVLLRMYGGNDGFNTVVPYQSGTYHDLRPTLAVTEGLHVLDAARALRPEMTSLKAHYDAGRLAIVQSVGYSPPSLSHFRSEAIWQSAVPDAIEPTGWIGRYLDTLAPAGDPAVRAVGVSYGLDQVFVAGHANAFALQGAGDSVYFPTDDRHAEDADLKRAAFDTISLEPRAAGSVAAAMAQGGYVLSRNVDVYRAIPDDGTTTYPDTDLARRLRETARMIGAARRGDISAGVFQVGIDGFDTHADQDAPGGHPALWADIDGALDAFHAELVARGAADDVLVVAYSEFGRRPEENGSKGTDHGTAAPVFVFGNPVVGGIYGTDPDLTVLDADGNPAHETDFRSIYREVLERWLPSGDPEAVLGADYAQFPLAGFLP